MVTVLCRDGTSSIDDVLYYILIMVVLHIDGIHTDGMKT